MTHITFFEGQGLLYPAMEGAKKQGYSVNIASKPKDKVIACWGWRNGEMLRARGYEVLVFERGYIGNRHHWTSIGWNGLNGRADFCLPDNIDPSRFNSHFSMKPWKSEGEYIVIMGQIQGDMSLGRQDMTPIYERLAENLELMYDKPVYFRPHPHAHGTRMNFTPKICKISGDLQSVLDNCHLCVTYNSNSAVDAVLYGVPSVSLDEGSMAFEVTSHYECDRITPDRAEWAARLAHTQWSPEEVESGVFWERMLCRLENLMK